MKYKIGDKFKDRNSLIIEIIGFEGNEYVVTWKGGFPNTLDEQHLDEYYEKINEETI
jgi:hypothetical protein